MSLLTQEMMRFGKPSPIVEKIINGTDSVAHTKKENPNLPQCPQCGSTAFMRFIDNERHPNHIVEIWDCCGCKKRFRFMFKINLISVDDITGEY